MTITASSYPLYKSHYSLLAPFFVVVFFISILIFTNRALDPTLPIYHDLSRTAGARFVEVDPLPGNSSGSLSIEDDNLDSENFSTSPAKHGFGFHGNLSDERKRDESVGVRFQPVETSRGNLTGERDEQNDDESVGTAFEAGDKSLSNLEVEKKERDGLPDAVTDAGSDVEGLRSCDFFAGRWIKDNNYPLYEPSSCPYVDEAFDCQRNGRQDSEYLKWRWKPDGCDLPRFNATDFLVRLRGKRLMLVGDSMNRNQFESMLCLLREGLADKSKMYEVHGYKITKGRGRFVFKFEEYNCTVDFVRSHFLVKEGVRVNAQGNSNPTLSIDQIDKTHARWKRADILVFNTGHWWVHGKTARGISYYKEGDYLYPKFDSTEAYRRALKTWANWIRKNIDTTRQMVFYRGYSSAHFRGGDWDSGGSCHGETEPIERGAFLESYPQKMKIVEEVLQKTRVPVTLLNVTKLTNFRKDGHPSVYGKINTEGRKVSTRRQDCSHWCLPGVPDAWNELIYSTLVARQGASGA